MSYIDPLRESVGPMRYASFQHRLGAYALDIAISALTFGIGWLVWSLALGLLVAIGERIGRDRLTTRLVELQHGAIWQSANFSCH